MPWYHPGPLKLVGSTAVSDVSVKATVTVTAEAGIVKVFPVTVTGFIPASTTVIDPTMYPPAGVAAIVTVAPALASFVGEVATVPFVGGVIVIAYFGAGAATEKVTLFVALCAPASVATTVAE